MAIFVIDASATLDDALRRAAPSEGVPLIR
jgi:hypothetical protein